MQNEPGEQITEEETEAAIAIQKIAKDFNCDMETAAEIFDIADIVICCD